MIKIAKGIKSKSKRKSNKSGRNEVRTAINEALAACNYACIQCWRSYNNDGIHTKCYVMSRHPIQIDVLCQDCRALQLAKAREIGDWISAPRIFRDADPNSTDSAPF